MRCHGRPFRYGILISILTDMARLGKPDPRPWEPWGASHLCRVVQNFGHRIRPHPGPFPQGEGEWSSAGRPIERRSHPGETARAAPSPWGLSLPTSLMAGYEPTRFWRRDTAERAKIFFCWFSLYLPLVTFSYLEGPLAPGGAGCMGPGAMAEPKAGGAQANGPRGCGRGVAPGKRRTAPVPKAVKSAAAGLTSPGLDGPFTGGV